MRAFLGRFQLCNRKHVFTVQLEEVFAFWHTLDHVGQVCHTAALALRQKGFMPACRADEILDEGRGTLRVKPDAILCDLYRYLEGGRNALRAYRGEHMSACYRVGVTERLLTWRKRGKSAGYIVKYLLTHEKHQITGLFCGHLVDIVCYYIT